MSIQVRILLEAVITEREGMIAENKQREIEGKSLAYTEEDFIEVARQLRILLEQL